MTLESILERAEWQSKPFLSGDNLYVSIDSDQFKGTYRIGLVQDITEIDRYGSKPRKYCKSEFSDLLRQNEFSARFYYDEGKLYLGLSVDGIERTFRLGLIENPTHVDPKTLRPLVNASFQANFEYANGLFDWQKYERPHSNEESQTRPKIPFREIDAIRYRTRKMRRAKYMAVDRGIDISDEHSPSTPQLIKFRSGKETTWAYTPIVKMPKPSLY